MPVSSTFAAAPGPSEGIRMRRVWVPMRDGIRLNAAIYLPRSAPERIPVCMELTPYTLDLMHDVGQTLARGGLGYLVVDVRGRGDSEGQFRQFVNDARDGVDIVEWITHQPWSDGRVVLTGGSYTGLNQWLIMGEGHPAIVAAAPQAAVAVGIDFPHGGVPSLHNATWESLVWGHTLNGMSGTDRGLWIQEIREARDAGRPISVVGEPFALDRGTDWMRFLRTPGPESFIDMLPAEQGLRSSNVPVLSITGTHDFCMSGTIFHFERYAQLASPAAVQRSHLVVGPWDHAGTGPGPNSVGSLEFSEAARVPLDEVRIGWFRHILFDEPLPEFLGDRVLIYLAGTEEWRSAGSLREATSGTQALGLQSMDGPNDAFHSGWLVDADGGGPDVTITFDPDDRRVLDLESAMRPDTGLGDPSFPMNFPSLLATLVGAHPTDQVFSISVDGDGLVYHSPPIKEPLVLIGIPSLRLIVVPDQPDADICAILHEVRPDGEAILLSAESVRMSRCTAGGASVVVGEENVLELADFRFVCRTLGPGSRLRLTLRSAWSSMLPPGGDDPSSMAATLIVRHRPETCLVLPLGSPGSIASHD